MKTSTYLLRAFPLLALSSITGCGDDTGPGGGGGAGGSTTATGPGPSTGSTSGTGSSGTSTASASTSTGMFQNSGDCDDNADCPGSMCIEVVPGGFRVCADIAPEATTCMSPGDACCTSADCMMGSCYDVSTLPQCGGVVFLGNQCLTDGCASDADCFDAPPADGVCLPPGAFGMPKRECAVAYCLTDLECTAEAGGICAPVDNPCCSKPAGLACVYPSGCRFSSDCPAGYCEIDFMTGEGVCKPGAPICPA